MKPTVFLTAIDKPIRLQVIGLEQYSVTTWKRDKDYVVIAKIVGSMITLLDPLMTYEIKDPNSQLEICNSFVSYFFSCQRADLSSVVIDVHSWANDFIGATQG